MFKVHKQPRYIVEAGDLSVTADRKTFLILRRGIGSVLISTEDLAAFIEMLRSVKEALDND